MKTTRSKFIYGLAGLAVFLFGWRFIFPVANTWTAFYYPEKNDKRLRVVSVELETIDQCYDWVQVQKNSRQDEESSFECGKDCEYNEELHEYVCDIVAGN